MDYIGTITAKITTSTNMQARGISLTQYNKRCDGGNVQTKQFNK